MRPDIRRGSTLGWYPTLLADPAEFRSLGPAWDDLYARCNAATPFQSHAWLASWWQQYGRRHGLRVLVLRRQEQLLAALPLVRTWRWGCRVLSPLGQSLSDFTDVLVDDEESGTLLPAAAEELLRVPGWDAMDFPEVRPGATVERLHACWPRNGWRMTASCCLSMPAVPLKDQVAAMSGRSAGKLRRHLRKIDDLGVRATAVRPEQVPAAMDELLRLHNLQWSGRGINPEHLRPRFREHLVHSAVRLVGAGQAALTEFRVGERLVAANLSIVGTDFAGGYLYGTDPWLRTQVDTFAMIVQHELGQAHERGLREVSMLRGGEPHKAKWGAVAVDNQRLLFARTPAASAYAAAVRLRAHAARTIKARFPALAGQPPAPAEQ
ncbi:GNAT family N-acetyltransferase [Nonomuraea sp. NPDC050310]|uniref:GNAT family N-acetyltransferase n=1 Tax=unclassified Nonomuraea TaxID=2593643 RepID=UPI0033E90570